MGVKFVDFLSTPDIFFMTLRVKIWYEWQTSTKRRAYYLTSKQEICFLQYSCHNYRFNLKIDNVANKS